MSQKIECDDCGNLLPNEWIHVEKRENCPQCGSSSKRISIGITDRIDFPVKESLSGKVKDSNYNSKKNPRYEFFEGDELRRSDGKWITKKRIIDKNNDSYFEEVVDPETGKVIHKCEEPLSEHFGHGSAKLPKA